MPSFSLTKVISEFPAPRGMPQLTQCLRLYLTYPFTCDIEVVFFLPWAITFRQLGWFGLIEMFIFIAILLVGYVYAWRKGALEWE